MAHRISQRGEPLDLGVPAQGDPSSLSLVLGPRLPVLGVRALVLDQRPLIEVHDPGDRLVEQFYVVTDDEQRPPVRPKKACQPVLGVAVEVVRRLVEQ